VTASSTLKEQAQALSDLTADRAADEAAGSTSATTTNEHDVVIVAPALTLDPAATQFGDLIGDGTEDLSTTSDISAVLSTEQSNEQKAAETSIASSAKKLRATGSKLILMARNLPNVTADAFVKTSNAYDIGKMQATQLASKLELTEATASNPKRIEIVLPKESNTTISSDFFSGVWSVLGSYFKEGKVVSVSGRLTSASTAADWKKVLLSVNSAAQAQHGFNVLLDESAQADSESAPVALDGVIAANDFLSTQVMAVLKNRGYKGSGADINPEITLSGIVGNMTGNTDLSKDKVPSPTKSEDSASLPSSGSSSNDTSAAQTAAASQWPIVTGYGSYVNNISSVVSGKQWLTGLENRTGLAKDLAKECATVAKTGKIAASHSTDSSTQKTTVTLNGHKVPLITRGLVAVVGSNLKTELIDTGYVSAADAGL
jgi:ABC-type xylose transport system substrate-binding protein